MRSVSTSVSVSPSKNSRLSSHGVAEPHQGDHDCCGLDSKQTTNGAVEYQCAEKRLCVVVVMMVMMLLYSQVLNGAGDKVVVQMAYTGKSTLCA